MMGDVLPDLPTPTPFLFVSRRSGRAGLQARRAFHHVHRRCRQARPGQAAYREGLRWGPDGEDCEIPLLQQRSRAPSALASTIARLETNARSLLFSTVLSFGVNPLFVVAFFLCLLTIVLYVACQTVALKYRTCRLFILVPALSSIMCNRCRVTSTSTPSCRPEASAAGPRRRRASSLTSSGMPSLTRR